MVSVLVGGGEPVGLPLFKGVGEANLRLFAESGLVGEGGEVCAPVPA
jgi:hypothetical protein